jgi:hypothetical protein
LPNIRTGAATTKRRRGFINPIVGATVCQSAPNICTPKHIRSVRPARGATTCTENDPFFTVVSIRAPETAPGELGHKPAQGEVSVLDRKQKPIPMLA